LVVIWKKKADSGLDNLDNLYLYLLRNLHFKEPPLDPAYNSSSSLHISHTFPQDLF